MEKKMDINTAELIIDQKYIIKPLMTIEDIKNSNLKEILDEKSKIQLDEDPTHLFIRRLVYGEEVSVRLDINKERLMGIYITVDPEMISESYHADENILNIQIPKIEGIDEVEHKKIQELCNLYGKFPSENNIVESVMKIKNKLKSVHAQINILNQEKINLESVEEAFKVIDDIYTKYEASGFDKDLLKENENNSDKYEKAKELLKTTDIKDKVELRNRIEAHKNNLEKLLQTKNDLNMESTQISDSYSAYQKYKDIGTTKLDKLKKELLCNLKAKDELSNVIINSDKMTQEFCQEKIKEIDISIHSLDREINSIGIMDKNGLDYKIDYMKEKSTDKRRYLKENHPLNDSNKEAEIKEITKNAIEDIAPNTSNKLKAINELYNIENKIAQVKKEIELKQEVSQLQKEIELKQEVIELQEETIALQKEGKILETAKEKLEMMDKYKSVMDIMAQYKSNKFFKKSYESKYSSEIKQYNKAKDDLELIEINTWDKYKESKNAFDKKEQSLLEEQKLLGDGDISKLISVDNTKELERINEYKNKQNEIIKKHGTPVKVK